MGWNEYKKVRALRLAFFLESSGSNFYSSDKTQMGDIGGVYLGLKCRIGEGWRGVFKQHALFPYL